MTGGFPSQRANTTENISLLWHYHENKTLSPFVYLYHHWEKSRDCYWCRRHIWYRYSHNNQLRCSHQDIYRPFYASVNCLLWAWFFDSLSWWLQCCMQYRVLLDHVIARSDCHDDVMTWTHFPRYRPFVRGIHRPPLTKGHLRGLYFLWC